jgi:membrane-bound metal-dependent hydrolase YbcI (DUF457 family)
MFVGHFAVAFAAKRAEPKLSLPVLFAAAQFLDILWPIFILIGVEHSRIVPGITATAPLDLFDIPYSHSLFTSLAWSVLFAVPFLRTRGKRAALIVGACVFSHFILDVVTHRPDMPVAPGLPQRMGLGLWKSLPASIVVESLLFAGGIALYVRGTRPVSKMGSVGLWALVILLTAIWLSGVFLPPPPNIQAVAVSILVMILIVIGWSRAIDRARLPLSVVPGAR